MAPGPPPPPETISFHGWARLNESSFLLKVQQSTGFQRLIGNYSKLFSVPLDDDNLQSFAEDVCRCCLSEADDAMFNSASLEAALQEVEHYKQKLNLCNLSAMKQIAAMRDGHESDMLKNDTIVFHEPLHYMDEEQQKLVLAVVCDKLRQLENGSAPASLVEALTRYANALLMQEECAGLDELLEVQSGLEKVRVQKKAVQVRLEHQEKESSRLLKELEEVRSNLAETAKAYEELKELEPTWQESLEELRDLSENQKAQIEQQQMEIDAHQAVIERQQRDMQHQREESRRLSEDLELQKEASEALRDQLSQSETTIEELYSEITNLTRSWQEEQSKVTGLQEEIAEERSVSDGLRGEIEQLQLEAQALQGELAELQLCHAALQEEAEALRAELARRNNTLTCETQTEITGAQMDEEAAETQRLRVMIEEMQMKVRDVLERFRRRFGSEAKELCRDMNLEEWLREDTALQCLYDDCLARVDLLEKLRDKVKKERSRLGMSDPDEASVLATVGRSDLRGAKKFISDVSSSHSSDQSSDRGYPMDRAATEVPKAPPRGAESSQSLSRMSSSVSLPSLHTGHQNVAVLNLNLGSARRRYSKG